MDPDWRHRLLAAISNPNLALILLMIGVYGLILEFGTVGFGVAGVVGAICLLLGLFALQMLPISYTGLALLLLGFALLGAEMLVPSFGVLGVGGTVALVVGGIFLLEQEVPGFTISRTLLVALAASALLLVMLVGGAALRARRSRVVSGREALVGARGEVMQFDGSITWASIMGERWQVRAARPLALGQRVRVRAVDGLVLEVDDDGGVPTTRTTTSATFPAPPDNTKGSAT